jgi:peptidoglycan hydrolase CwlO-like protein
LREFIEHGENRKQSDIQAATASQNNEISHFKRMVGSLRTELDEKGKLYEYNLQKEGKAYTKEIDHLQKTIIELRARLEND